MRRRLVYTDDLMKSIIAECDRRKAWKEGGLQLAWIEKAVNDTQTADVEADDERPDD